MPTTRLRSALPVAALLLGLAAPAIAQHFCPCGDADTDGDLDIIDALQVARHAVGLAPLSELGAELGDVNRDEVADVLDVFGIASVNARLLPPPTECGDPMRFATTSSLVPDPATGRLELPPGTPFEDAAATIQPLSVGRDYQPYLMVKDDPAEMEFDGQPTIEVGIVGQTQALMLPMTVTVPFDPQVLTDLGVLQEPGDVEVVRRGCCACDAWDRETLLARGPDWIQALVADTGPLSLLPSPLCALGPVACGIDPLDISEFLFGRLMYQGYSIERPGTTPSGAPLVVPDKTWANGASTVVVFFHGVNSSPSFWGSLPEDIEAELPGVRCVSVRWATGRPWAVSLDCLNAELDATVPKSRAAGGSHTVVYVGHSMGSLALLNRSEFEKPDFIVSLAGAIETSRFGPGALARDVLDAIGVASSPLSIAYPNLSLSMTVQEFATTLAPGVETLINPMHSAVTGIRGTSNVIPQVLVSGGDDGDPARCDWDKWVSKSCTLRHAFQAANPTVASASIVAQIVIERGSEHTHIRRHCESVRCGDTIVKDWVERAHRGLYTAVPVAPVDHDAYLVEPALITLLTPPTDFRITTEVECPKTARMHYPAGATVEVHDRATPGAPPLGVSPALVQLAPGDREQVIIDCSFVGSSTSNLDVVLVPPASIGSIDAEETTWKQAIEIDLQRPFGISPPSCEIVSAPSGTVSDIVPLIVNVDLPCPPGALHLEFSQGGQPFQTARLRFGVVNPYQLLGGGLQVFEWNSVADGLGTIAAAQDVRLRAWVDNNYTASAACVTDPFVVDNVMLPCPAVTHTPPSPLRDVVYTVGGNDTYRIDIDAAGCAPGQSVWVNGIVIENRSSTDYHTHSWHDSSSQLERHGGPGNCLSAGSSRTFDLAFLWQPPGTYSYTVTFHGRAYSSCSGVDIGWSELRRLEITITFP